MILRKEIESICGPEFDVSKLFLARLAQGKLTRDESPLSHFCVYFLPYHQQTQEVFMTHHKKSGLWLAPGGHIDEGEVLFQALLREIQEELGEELAAECGLHQDLRPFLLTVTSIPKKPNYACRVHYDIWYGIPTDGSNFKVDPAEFHETRWLSVAEARQLETDESNLQALRRMEILFKVKAFFEKAP